MQRLSYLLEQKYNVFCNQAKPHLGGWGEFAKYQVEPFFPFLFPVFALIMKGIFYYSIWTIINTGTTQNAFRIGHEISLHHTAYR